MKKIWKKGISLVLGVGMILSAGAVMAAPSAQTVKTDGVAAYVSGDTVVDSSILKGDIFAQGDLNINVKPVAGKTGILGTIFTDRATQTISGDAADAYASNLVQDSFVMPDMKFTTPKRPEGLPERGDLTLNWNDYKRDENGNLIFEGVAISQSGHYSSINGKGPIYFDTSEHNLVITVDSLKLVNGIHIAGAGSVTIFVPAEQADLTNCTVVRDHEASSFNVVATGGDLTLHGYIGFFGNLYVPDGNLSMDKIDLVGLLSVGGNKVNFTGNNTGVRGVLYAPEATVTLEDNARIMGTVVAKELDLMPSTKLIYDPTYLDLNVDDGNWDITVDPEQPDVNEPEKPVEPENPNEDPQPSVVSPEPVDVSGMVTGLKAEYYAFFDDGKQKFPEEAKIMEQRMDEVRFNYGWGTPDELLQRRDRFSVRFTGYIVPQETGVYNFSTLSDDGVYMKLGGKVIINNWNDMALNYSYAEPVTLEAGKAYAVDIEYYDNTEISTIALFWQIGDRMELVPATSLYTQPMKEKSYFNETKYITSGLCISYYNSLDGALDDQAIEDAVAHGIIDFDLNGTAPHSNINPDQYSAKFYGYLEAPVTGKLTLSFIVDDGLVVEFDGKTLIDEWHANNIDNIYQVTVDVEAGQRYPITVRYNNMGQRGTGQMLWQWNGVEQQIVSMEYLFEQERVLP